MTDEPPQPSPSDEPVASPAAPSTPASRWQRVRSWIGLDHHWRLIRTLLFALLGAVVGILIFGRVHERIGPFDTTVSVRPAMRGVSTLHLAPLGTIELDTHHAPVAIDVRVDQLRPDEAERIAKNPEVLRQLETEIGADTRRALVHLFARTMAMALLGGAVGGLLSRARPGDAVRGAVVAGLVTSALVAGTAGTFDSSAIAEPRYTGLLTVAPKAVGDVQAVVDHFHDYSAQLADLVGNLASLYRAAQGLPTLSVGGDTIRILHVSDIHNNPQAFDLMDQLVTNYEIEAVVDTGDITDWGSGPESQQLNRVAKLGVPYIWVRGNHDSMQVQQAMAAVPNAVVLDGGSAEVAGLRLWGIGDPRYTPDKDQPTGSGIEADEADAFAPKVATELRADEPPAVDVVLVHDPRSAAGVGALVPLILAGHIHSPRESHIGAATLLVEGSTGGAGLSTLKDEQPHPLTASVLYFDRTTRRLLVYDQLTVDGLGGAGARIERHVMATTAADGAVPPSSSGPPPGSAPSDSPVPPPSS